jgi:hypothetical protein
MDSFMMSVAYTISWNTHLAASYTKFLRSLEGLQKGRLVATLDR